MKTYIAGPMTGIPQHNHPAFAYTATVLRAMGIEVRSPHEIDAGSTDRAWEWYMREALKLLLECDRVVLLLGWEHSRGARIERDIAAALSMPMNEWTGSDACYGEAG